MQSYAYLYPHKGYHEAADERLIEEKIIILGKLVILQYMQGIIRELKLRRQTMDRYYSLVHDTSKTLVPHLFTGPMANLPLTIRVIQEYLDRNNHDCHMDLGRIGSDLPVFFERFPDYRLKFYIIKE